MIFIIYSDIHKFAPHEIEVDFEFGENIIYLGDIVDLGACKYKDLPKANKFLYDLIKKADGNFASGNHEKMMEHLHLKKDNVLFTHGDLIFKDLKKVKDFRWGREGSGFFRRFFVFLGSFFRRFLKKNRMILDKDMDVAINWAKTFNCDTIVCGHKHPPELLFREKSGVKLYVVPRGKYFLDLS